MSAEIPSADGPSLVIFLPAGNLQVALRITFATEITALHERDGRIVVRLNVCFDAVELQLPNHFAQDQPQTLSHQTLPGIIGKRVKAGERALKWPANDVADIDDSHQAIACAMHDKKAAMVVRRAALHMGAERFQRFRR